MTVGLRNNNPGCLKRDENSTPYRGEIVPTNDPPWRQFESKAYGYRAMFHLILIRYIIDYNINTIRGIMNRYAPPTENDTLAYIDFVSLRTGIDADEVIKAGDTDVILDFGRAITKMENGVEPDESALMQGWQMLQNDKEEDLQQLMKEGRNPDDYKHATILIGVGILIVALYLIGYKVGRK